MQRFRVSLTGLFVAALALSAEAAAQSIPTTQVAGAKLVEDKTRVVWEIDCTTLDGWHSEGMNATVTKPEPETIKVTQEGNDTWGKAAFVVDGVNLEKSPLLEVKVNKVEKGSAFKVLIANSDWSEQIVVIDRSSADGVHDGDVWKAIKRESRKKESWYDAPFNLVVVIEGRGKASWFDYFKLREKN